MYLINKKDEYVLPDIILGTEENWLGLEVVDDKWKISLYSANKNTDIRIGYFNMLK